MFGDTCNKMSKDSSSRLSYNCMYTLIYVLIGGIAIQKDLMEAERSQFILNSFIHDYQDWNYKTMKDKTKKMLLAMLLLVMTSTTAFADVVTGSCGENATYSLDTDTGIITIEGSGRMSDYDYGYVSGAPNSVTTAPWRDYYNSISKVVIGEGITYVGKSSFYGCISLTNINFSESLKTIGERAFQECSALTSLNIPKNLESYGFLAFKCQTLTSITVDEENLYFDSREDCNAIIRKSDNRLMLGCANTVIPSSVLSISDRAFYDCINLSSLNIPEKVSSIGVYAFSGCTALTSLRVDLENPYFDSRDDCNAVIKTSKNELIVGIKTTVIPNSVTRIGDYAFSNCDFTSISIPEGVTSIGSWSFAYSNLKSINLPSRLKTIESYAFYDCASLESINIPNYVTSIGSQTFSFCYNLKTATIGKYVNSIGQDAFYYCKNLTELILLPSTPPEVKEDYYSDDLFDRVSLIVPRKYIDRYKEDDYWGQFKDIRHSTVLTVAPVKTEMLVGETLKLEVERSADIENQPITWSSSNSSIAEVNDGNVTALSEGIAEITASCDGMTATCQISVVRKKRDEIVWGYCDDYVGSGVGNGTKKPIKCAIRIPASALQDYKDCTITKIDVGVSDNVTELVPVISTGGEENYAAQAAIKGYTGWNAIELDNPYVIGSQDLYVGYECVGTYAAALSNIYSQNGSYIYWEGAWEDYSAQEWGSFCIRIHIKGYDLPMDVSLQTDKTVECALGESLIVTPSVQNLSPEIVESLTFNCYIDDVFEGSHEVSANIGKGKIEDVPFAITSPSTSGMYNVKIQVEYINGKKDDNASNNTVTIPLTILGKKYDRRVVMEEITGTWCGYCVRGYHAMKTMAERYPDNFIGIAIHGSDEMSGAENYSSIISMLGGSYPSSIANRNSKYKLNASLDEMETAVLAMKDNAIADINAEVEVLDADTTEVKIKTNVEFGMDMSVPFRIAYVVVENGVGPYVQTSYYSGSTTDLGGLENEGSYISLMFNDVARGIYSGFNGVRGSVPSTIISGEVYSYDYSMLLPDNIDNKANVEIVAMLINQNSGEIVNACKCKLREGSNNISGIKDDSSETPMIYNINGIRLDAPQRGLNIIRMNNGETMKVMVR